MEDCGHIPVWTGQRVARTNARGRRAYCAPFKAWIIEQAMRPGMWMAWLAMRNQVNAKQLRCWVRLHRQQAVGEGAVARLVPVTIAPPSVPTPTAARSVGAPVEIELAGAVVCVRAEAAPATLRMALDVFRGMTP